MKTIFKFSALLIAIFLLSLNSASAQWKTGSSGGASPFTDTIVLAGGSGNGFLMITGTLTTDDPFSIHRVGCKGSHYYQIVATSSQPAPVTFSMYDDVSVFPVFTILDQNLNTLSSPGSSLTLPGGHGESTTTFEMTPNATYYVEVTYDVSVSDPGSVPFLFTIGTGVLSATQVTGSTKGMSTGVPWIKGNLTSSSAHSHARTGCFADYYTLTGPGTTNLMMTGFDTYLYLYDSNFNLIAKNDDATPPGHGGSLINQVLAVSGTYYVEATSYIKGFTGSYTISTSLGGLSPISNPWDPIVSGSSSSAYPIAYSSISSLSSASMSNVRSGSYANYYRMDVTTDGAATISTTGMVGVNPVDTYLYLYDGSGNLIAQNDDHTPPGSGGALISSTFASGKTYYIEVTTYRAAKSGRYTIVVASPNGGAAGTVTPVARPF